MRLLCFCAAVAILLPPACSQVTGITVTPVPPPLASVVSIQISGNLPDGCYSDPTVQTSVSGQTVTITLNSTVSGEACTAALIPFTKTATVGPLAPGTYNVSAALFGNGNPVGAPVTTSFSVPIVVPAASLTVLVLLGIGLAAITFRLVRSA